MRYTMIHKYAIRKIVKTGEESRVEFGEIDGNSLGIGAQWQDGYPTDIALHIVNKWNYVATLQNRVEFIYYLPAVESASETMLKKDPFYRAGGGPA